MKKLLMVLAVCCNIYAGYAQTITGHLVDEGGIPLEYSNVILLNAKDSSFVVGCVTGEDGKFALANSNNNGKLLKITHIGYEDLYYPVSEMTANIGILKLKTKSTTLNEVSVIGSKPMFRQKNGSLITDVSGSVLSQLHEFTELVSQIPGIVKTANGGFEVFGLGSPVIYINNKKIQDQAELRQLSPKDIKSIELISNPDAKYDAEGKAVLKIVMLKKEDGLTFQLGSSAKQNRRSSYGNDMKIGFKHQKLSFSANFSYDNTKNRSILPQTKELFLGENTHRYIQDQTAKGHLTNNEWQMNMDYEINDKHNIGLEWNSSNNKDNEHRISTLDYQLNNKLAQSTDILNDYINKTKYNHVNLFYNAQWSKLLSTEFNLDYANNNNKYNQETNETTESVPKLTISTGNNMLDIYSGKFSFDYNLNEKFGLSWGIECNHINITGSLTSDSGNTPSSNYSNRENKYAAYAEAKLNMGDVLVNGGLRYEELVSDYKNLIDRTGDVHRHYKNIYPSISLIYNKNGWANTLSFSSRTSRPTFRQLSNSSYYSNEFMYQCGNPLLKPSDSYIAQWNTGYKFINFSASYTYMKNYISTDFYTSSNNQNQIVSSYINYDKIQYFKANLNVQKNIAWWKPSLSLGITKPFFSCEYLGEKRSCNTPQLYVMANQYFQLPASYLLSAYYYYNSGGNQGAVTLKPYQMFNMGIQKAFFDGKLSVNLLANDIFHTMKFKETENIKNIHFQQTEDYCLWNYSISIIYRLNKVKTKYRGNTSIKNELDRL